MVAGNLGASPTNKRTSYALTEGVLLNSPLAAANPPFWLREYPTREVTRILLTTALTGSCRRGIIYDDMPFPLRGIECAESTDDP